MALAAGIDSSTQSVKVVVCDLDSGVVVREGSAPHPAGTEVDPLEWWKALGLAAERAGGLDDVQAVSVAAQQHGLVALGEQGEVVRPALLWNDMRSAAAADELVRELGRAAWAEAVGSVPTASFTVAKLRYIATDEPEHAARVAAVCLPHDWITWQLAGAQGLEALRTDRGDASGTGYWSPVEGAYRHDLLMRALGHDASVPAVLGPSEPAGVTLEGAVLGPGTGDNMAAALGTGAGPGDLIVSVGTSGVVCGVSPVPAVDETGVVNGFADATGRFLPLVCTLNGAPVLSAVARILGVGLDELSGLALSAPAGADGVVLVPYFDGERTPNLPGATASLVGLRQDNTTPANVARAAVEGLLCGLAAGLDALIAAGVAVKRVFLVGGGARSEAVRRIAPSVLGLPVVVPRPGEYVALGAARQAAWVLTGGDEPPPVFGGVPEARPTAGGLKGGAIAGGVVGDAELYECDPEPLVREQYRRATA